MSHVFISYSRDDMSCVDLIVNRLEAQGIPIWIDKYNIPGGEWWAPAIQEGIREAAVVLIIWSQTAKISDHVRDEIKWSLQQKAQHPNRNLQIIPVLLESFDTNPLPESLDGLNAIELSICDNYEKFKKLLHRLLEIDKVQEITRQIISGFSKATPIKDLPDASAINEMLHIAPIMQSVHSIVYLVGYSGSSLEAQILKSPATIQLCLLMRGNESDYSFLEQVHEFVGENFMALYITVKPGGGQISLDNQRQGQWLDVVNTTYEVASKVIGRGTPTILQVFSLAPAVLTFAIGTRFYEYWQLQFFNRVEQSYCMVLDNRDLPYKI